MVCCCLWFFFQLVVSYPTRNHGRSYIDRAQSGLRPCYFSLKSMLNRLFNLFSSHLDSVVATRIIHCIYTTLLYFAPGGISSFKIESFQLFIQYILILCCHFCVGCKNFVLICNQFSAITQDVCEVSFKHQWSRGHCHI